MCAARVRKAMSANAAEWIKHLKDPKFLTLTLKHTDAPLSHQVSHLYKYFALLRKRKDLEKLFHGGIWFFQIKFNSEYEQFHPHLHILLDGEYVPQSLISSIWLDVTGDSSIVDIRKIWDVDKAANEVSRYAATPCSLTKLDLPWAITVVRELEGRKLCGTFGTARRVHLRQQEERDPGNRERIGSFGMIVGLAGEGPEAKAIMKAFYSHEPVSDEMLRAYQMKFDEGFQQAVRGLTVRPPPPQGWFHQLKPSFA